MREPCDLRGLLCDLARAASRSCRILACVYMGGNRSPAEDADFGLVRMLSRGAISNS
jgi:hypothetical protein